MNPELLSKALTNWNEICAMEDHCLEFDYEGDRWYISEFDEEHIEFWHVYFDEHKTIYIGEGYPWSDYEDLLTIIANAEPTEIVK